jgi:hypothetical protein
MDLADVYKCTECNYFDFDYGSDIRTATHSEPGGYFQSVLELKMGILSRESHTDDMGM